MTLGARMVTVAKRLDQRDMQEPQSDLAKYFPAYLADISYDAAELMFCGFRRCLS